MKRKRRLTQSGRVLRRLAVLAVLLSLCQAVGLYSFFPSPVIRFAGEAINAGPLRVVRTLGPLPLEKAVGSKLWLCANEKVTVLVQGGFRPLGGWYSSGWDYLDCARPAPAHIGAHAVFDREENTVWYLYGRVDEPGAERLQVWVGEDTSRPLRLLTELDKEAWAEGYLLREIPWTSWESQYVAVALLDGEGQSLWRENVVGNSALLR